MGGERGFTLVEVLVALALLSSGMLATLRVTALSLRLHDRSRKIVTSVALAGERLEMIGASGWQAATVGWLDEEGGECAAEEVECRRHTVIRPRAVYRLVLARRSEGAHTERYTVTCSWEGRGGAAAPAGRIHLSTVEGSAP